MAATPLGHLFKYGTPNILKFHHNEISHVLPLINFFREDEEIMNEIICLKEQD
jgi:hypothetical protein